MRPVFDLRSDTVTVPTAAMRAAMAAAEVGDDVMREDPTVEALQRRAAELFGKPDALFVASGTMGNQVCLGALTRPGDEVLAEEQAHILWHEVGSAARLWGLQIRLLPGRRGLMDPDDVAAAVRDRGDVHNPFTTMLSLENTHNFAGGVVLPLDYIDRMVAVAREHGLRLHMDGARIFNAQVASGQPVARIVRDMDLVSVCLSKGLGAPVGSLVVGSTELIAECRRLRKALGGGMRQVGVLAAAAAIALEEGPGLMLHDHRRARALAEELAALPGCGIDLDTVQTNIVICDVPGDAFGYEPRFAALGVKLFAIDKRRLRFVFHRDVGDDALDAAVSAARKLFG